MSKLNAKERKFYDLVVKLTLVVNTMLVYNYHFPSKQEIEKHTKIEVGDLVVEVSTLNNKRFNLGRLGYFVKQEGDKITIRRMSDGTLQPWFSGSFAKVPLDLREWFWNAYKNDTQAITEDFEILKVYADSPTVRTNRGYFARISYDRWYLDDGFKLIPLDNSVAIEKKYNDYLKTNVFA